MLNIKKMTNQLELSFWSHTIKLLSESRLLRRVLCSILPAFYVISRREGYQPTVRVALFCSLSGLLVGLVVGVLSIF